MKDTPYSELLSSQRNFFLSGGTRDLDFRKDALRKLRQVVKANEEKLHKAILEDFGKSEFDDYATELGMIYGEIGYMISHMKRYSRPERRRTNLANVPAKFRIQPEPLGCTLIIGAWNYPYQLTLAPMVDAIAAGCTCIVKPSELPANTMHVIAEMINTSFPSEYIHVVEGGVPETTELLSLKFDKIFFTGSPKVGRIVYEAAAKNMVPVTLELGGKSPVFVTAHADLELAAKRIVWGKFLNAGQTCVAPDYVYVDERVRDQFIEIVKAQILYNKYGDGAETYVRMINRRNFDRVVGLIDPEKVVFGGSSNPDTLFIEPTVMKDVTWDDKVMQEEIFGPVLPVLSYKSLDEAIAVVRSKEKPLSAYVFSGKSREQKAVMLGLSFGGGCINDVIMHLSNPNVPFGGVGNSGIGSYHGKEGFDCFSHRKTVMKKPAAEFNVKYPPYKNRKLSLIKKIM